MTPAESVATEIAAAFATAHNIGRSGDVKCVRISLAKWRELWVGLQDVCEPDAEWDRLVAELEIEGLDDMGIEVRVDGRPVEVRIGVEETAYCEYE